jgi:glycosyltransferase involved in cell wall biosynthesis
MHLCLAGMITDGLSYQENLLIKFHKKLGMDVSVITSQWIYGSNNELIKVSNMEYVDEMGVKYYRLSIKNRDNINNRLKKYNNVVKILDKTAPDILFIHNVQFLDIRQIVKYLKKHRNVTVYVDNHADFSNSGLNYISKYILHGVIWRYYAHMISPYTKKFYGVLPARVDFLENVYGLPSNKCELLVMGADDELVQKAESVEIKLATRQKHGISEDDFLIVTGGKIDEWKKQTLLLMEAVSNIKNEKVKLIVFGSVIPELKEKVNSLADGTKVQYIGWIKSDESYDYFATADLAVFPGRHSVFWEQVVAQGIPMLCKEWEGTKHVDVGGNVEFLTRDSATEIQDAIEELIDNPDKYSEMKKVAQERGKKIFSYKEIAKRSVELE